jgi:uncharacterized protein (DUF952 family)
MIYHAALPADWKKAQRSGLYTTSTRGRSLADEGFIHAAYESQVEGVANRFYADVDALVLLVIDPDAVGSPVVDEVPVDAPAGERYPHVYGPIPVAAVVTARPWRRDSSSIWAANPAVFGAEAAQIGVWTEGRPERSGRNPD